MLRAVTVACPLATYSSSISPWQLVMFSLPTLGVAARPISPLLYRGLKLGQENIAP